MKKVKVEKLTDAAFAPFGCVLTTDGREYSGEAGMFKWYEKQSCVDGADAVAVRFMCQ
jgi:ureidoglycolate hydrolase